MITLRATENEVAITKKLLVKALTDTKPSFTPEERSIMRLYYEQLKKETLVNEECYESYEVVVESNVMYGLR